MNPNPTQSPAWHGKLNLTFTHQADKTQLAYAEAQSPFKIQRPFYPEGDQVCHSVILHTAGGLVGGDQLSVDIGLSPNSHAVITTAAASKIYRTNGLAACQNIRARVSEQATLEWLPQEAIAFQGCNYQQTTRIELAESAQVILWDLMRFGRSAAGEAFLQGQVRSHTEVWQANTPLWIDRQQLQGSPLFWNSPNAFDQCPVLGSFVFLGKAISPELVQQLRSINLEALCDRNWGITRLPLGLLCRYRGASSEQARQWFTAIWHQLRLAHCARPACPPRVWPH